jgi:hypothetical protein
LHLKQKQIQPVAFEAIVLANPSPAEIKVATKRNFESVIKFSPSSKSLEFENYFDLTDNSQHISVIFPLSDSSEVILFYCCNNTRSFSSDLFPTKLSRYNDTGIPKNYLQPELHNKRDMYVKLPGITFAPSLKK